MFCVTILMMKTGVDLASLNLVQIKSSDLVQQRKYLDFGADEILGFGADEVLGPWCR